MTIYVKTSSPRLLSRPIDKKKTAAVHCQADQSPPPIKKRRRCTTGGRDPCVKNGGEATPLTSRTPCKKTADQKGYSLIRVGIPICDHMRPSIPNFIPDVWFKGPQVQYIHPVRGGATLPPCYRDMAATTATATATATTATTATATCQSHGSHNSHSEALTIKHCDCEFAPQDALQRDCALRIFASTARTK